MAKLQITLSSYIEQLVKELSEISGRSKTATVEDLLYRLESNARHNKLAESFGLDVIEAATIVNARGGGAKSLDPVQLDGGEHIGFDVELLERSTKTKTGFAGVSATGTSFRAIVPDVENGGGSKYLPSRPTALRAAIDRYEYCERYGIPYGNVGWHVEQAFKLKAQSTDEALAELRAFIAAGHTYGLKNPVTLEQVDAVIERRKTIKGVEPVKAPSQVKLEAEVAAIPEVILCAKCQQPIEEHHRFSAYGPASKGQWAHTACLPPD